MLFSLWPTLAFRRSQGHSGVVVVGLSVKNVQATTQ